MPLLGTGPGEQGGRLGALIRSRELRYLAVVVAGYAVDFGISFAAFKLLGIGLVAAAVIGFSVALTVNFLLLEFWVFGTGAPGLRARFAKYILAALLTLVLRAGIVAVLEPYAWSDPSRMAVLVIAAGISLVANYLLTRFGVFRKG